MKLKTLVLLLFSSFPLLGCASLVHSAKLNSAWSLYSAEVRECSQKYDVNIELIEGADSCDKDFPEDESDPYWVSLEHVECRARVDKKIATHIYDMDRFAEYVMEKKRQIKKIQNRELTREEVKTHLNEIWDSLDITMVQPRAIDNMRCQNQSLMANIAPLSPAPFLFQEYAASRLKIAKGYRDREISPADAEVLLSRAWAKLMKDEQAYIDSRRSVQQRNSQSIFDALEEIQKSQTKTQNTNCMMLGDFMDCTTSTY
jgi:hypothetical protein